MSTVNANQTMTCRLPAGHTMRVLAAWPDSKGLAERSIGGVLRKVSYLMADPTPYVFGPFEDTVDIRMPVEYGAYMVETSNDADETAPELVII